MPRPAPSFEFSRLLTGEISIGYAARNYVDPRLNRLAGPADLGLADLDRDAADHGEILSPTPRSTRPRCPASPACWCTPTPSRSITISAAGSRRSASSPTARYDYQGDGRNDKTYSLEGDLIYKMTRNLWIKGTLRRDILDSTCRGRARPRRW